MIASKTIFRVENKYKPDDVGTAKARTRQQEQNIETNITKNYIRFVNKNKVVLRVYSNIP